MALDKTLQQIQRQRFWRDRLIIFPLCFSLIFNFFIWLYIYFSLRGTTGAIPLHYNFLFGVDLIGPWPRLLKIPLTGLAIIILNFFLVFKFYSQKILVYFLLATIVLIQIILLIATALIVNL